MARPHFPGFTKPKLAPGVPTFRSVCQVLNAAGQPCGHEVTEMSFDGMVGDPGPQLEKFVHRLIQHIQQQHPQEVAAVGALTNRMFGFLILRNWEIGDARVLVEVEQFGGFLRHIAAKSISDEECRTASELVIKHTLASTHDEEEVTQLTALLAPAFAKQLQHMRDFLTERLKPQTPQPEVEEEEKSANA